MREIWVPLSIITLFLFLHIIRPYLKRFRAIDGLAWLPLLALLGSITLIPAYGFRPEAVPLLVYSAVLTVIVFFKHINGDIKFRSFRSRNFVFVLFPLLMLAASTGTAFYFTPKEDLALSTDGVHELDVNGYAVRVYINENDRLPQKRPLLVLFAPEFGSLTVIDDTAGKLRDNGFTVLACDRNKKMKPAEVFRYISAFSSGNSSAGANKRGREFEEKRKEDVLNILSWMQHNPGLYGTVRLFDIASTDMVYLAGYDAGGSALILLENTIINSGISVRGLIVIESALWSLYREEEITIPGLPANAGWFQSVKHGIGRWFMEGKPRRITGLAQVPRLSIPVLFLVSDRSRESKFSKSRHHALLECYAHSQGGSVIVSPNGAGHLDFSDFPVRYPIIASIARSSNAPVFNASVWNSIDAPAQTAVIIKNFTEELR